MKGLSWAIVYMVGAMIATLIVHDYFEAVLGPKKLGKKASLYLFVFYFILLWAVMFTGQKLLVAAVFFGGMLGISFCYKSDFKVRIIFCVILIVLQILAETLTAVLTSLFTARTVQYLTSSLLYYVQGELMSKLFVFVIVKIFSYYKCSVNLKMSRYFFIPLLAFPLSTAFIEYTLVGYVTVLTDTKPAVLVLCASLMLVVSNILLFYLFEKQLKQEEEKHHSQLVQQQLQYQAEYFHELADKHRFSNKTIHDLKNQLFAVSILLSDTGDNEKVGKAKEKIDELCSNIFSGQAVSKTGNDALDALINSKYQAMSRFHIRFTQNIFINPVNQIDDIDLCIVIGNALDNAIEACVKIPEGCPRDIFLKIMQVGDYLSIEMKNSTVFTAADGGAEQPLHIENGKIATSKSEKALHGFGLQSIDELSRKYSGNMGIDIVNGIFVLKIYMHNRLSNPILQK